MKLDIQQNVLHEPIWIVTLSRRNLKVLLAKLDGHPPQSACTIVGQSGRLIVRAEEDEAHYAGRIPPGEMHPDTEVKIGDS